ncbi:MAG: FAD-binding oxidoreductase, partial [Chloroflexota bacterium]
MISEAIINQLISVVGEDHLSITNADRAQHEKDQSDHAAILPDAVLWPANSQQVSEIVKIANENRIAITGWGAGSSLEGNTIPLNGGIVINFGRMNHIVKVHSNDFQVTVQPGIFYKDMNKVLAKHGLFFPPDPGANASIGGMVANNAAGSRTVKYGATRDNVLALEVVLASGEIIRTGSRSVKQSAGYDLTHLFTGSEGTLGLITEATLKLYPLPEYFSAVKAGFETTDAAAEAVFGIIGSGLNPAALELLDADTVQMIRDAEPIELAEGPHLFMEFNGASEVALAEELKLVEEICQDSGAILFGAGVGLDARNQMWEARHRLL